MPLSQATLEALKLGRARIGLEQNPAQLGPLREAYDGFRWKAATEDSWYFLRDLCKTKDEHPKVLGEPYQPFPDEPHLRDLHAQYWEVYARPRHRRLIVLKSRRMMASWFAAAMCLYDCLTKPAQTIGWLGKKADDTNDALERIQIMYRELPPSVQAAHPMDSKFGRIYFLPVRDRSGRITAGDSNIYGIPQPDEFGNQVRGYGYTQFVLDEYAFCVNAEAVYHTLLPALGEMGMLTVISTAAPGHFETIFTDHDTKTHRRLASGVETWNNHNHFRAVWIRWSCNPAHSEEWANALAAEHGGRKSPWWLREMEGDFRALQGGKVFPQFDENVHVIKPLTQDVLSQLPKWRFIDPGLNHYGACGWYTVIDGCLIKYREHCQRGWTVQQHCEAIKAMSGRERYEYTAMDPSGFADTLAGGGESVASLYGQHGVDVVKAYRSNQKIRQIQVMADLLIRQASGEPRFKYTNDCERSIWEIKNYRWRQPRSDDTPTPEEPVKIDDDSMDCDLYAAQGLNPDDYTATVRDPLEPWYVGRDPRKVSADQRRMLHYIQARMHGEGDED